jgi:hypothetical protein
MYSRLMLLSESERNISSFALAFTRGCRLRCVRIVAFFFWAFGTLDNHCLSATHLPRALAAKQIGRTSHFDVTLSYRAALSHSLWTWPVRLARFGQPPSEAFERHANALNSSSSWSECPTASLHRRVKTLSYDGNEMEWYAEFTRLNRIRFSEINR